MKFSIFSSEPDFSETHPEIQAFEIHNRFCGENGEPCQVCRLKAEREEGK